MTPTANTNLQAIKTLLDKSFGAGAAELSDNTVMAERERFSANQHAPVSLIGANYTNDGDMTIVAALDLSIEGVPEQALKDAIAEANDVGATYGSFAVRGPRLVFRVGLSGTTEAAVPGVILADTLAYVLNICTGAMDHFASMPRQ